MMVGAVTLLTASAGADMAIILLLLCGCFFAAAALLHGTLI
jgi:hypothetical protein